VELASQRAYVQRLHVLVQKERHGEQCRKRRQRKKNVGRIRELGRSTPRARLNQKRSYAQENQGRITKVQQARREGARAWAKAARRALAVNLPLVGLEDLSLTTPPSEGATDWRVDDSLLARLTLAVGVASEEDAARLLLAQRFPLALAARPLVSLSPGERLRAALICILQRRPRVELLVLDEPTDGLDLVGQGALRRILSAFGGGLLVASHDLAFLADIGIERRLRLDGAGGWRQE